MLRAEFLAIARTWIDTPWHHQTAVKGVGCDCLGFIRGSVIEAGLRSADMHSWPGVEQFFGYGRMPDGTSIQRACDLYLQRIEFKDVQPADVLLCRFRGGPAQHVGVFSKRSEDGRLYWIHADSQRHGTQPGKVEEVRLEFSPRYMMLVQAYRVPGLDG